MTMCEHSNSKPFDPLLGETYELLNDEMRSFSEKVSNDPPIIANVVHSKKEKFYIWSNLLIQRQLSGTEVDFSNYYKEFIKFDDLDETYEVTLPNVTLHNLISGQIYTDIGGPSTIKLL